MTPPRGFFVHLGYLDDSDTRAKNRKLQVMSGVLVQDKVFKYIEIGMRLVRDILIPADKLDAFTEFHACELYGGFGVFEGIPQPDRFQAIERLLSLLRHSELSVVYGAVDIDKAAKQVYGSADPLDISFRICVQEIFEWVKQRVHKYDIEKDEDRALEAWISEMVILIIDECDKAQRAMLQGSFRRLRLPLHAQRKNESASTRLPHLHDDMFFGDSRYSVGIQLADLCSYFIARHLEGDEEVKGFYEMIEPHIAYGQIYPDEQTFRVPQPLLMSPLLKMLSGVKSNGEPAVREVQSDNAEASESSPQQDQSQTGSGESC